MQSAGKELTSSMADAGGPHMRWLRRRLLVLGPAFIACIGAMVWAGLPSARLLGLVAVAAGTLPVAVFIRRTPPAGARRAVFVSLMTGLVTGGVANAITGGLASPYLVIMLGPAVVTVVVFGPSREAKAALAVLAAILVTLVFLPESLTGPAFPRRVHGLLALWAVAVTVVVLTVEFRLLSKGLFVTSRSLRSMQEELLQEATARRREIESLSSKVAHEIKNPLTALKSLLQLEKAAAREERSQKRFEVMSSELARMESIVRDYLSLSRPLLALASAEVDLGRVADDVVAVLEGRAGDAGVTLKREGKGAIIVGDERRLKEALLNVTQNALEATPQGGLVAVAVDDAGDEGARVVVRDSGTGIAPAVAGRLGTSFVTTRAGGTGLGLSIARSIVTQHHGTLELGNRPDGSGAVATIVLPRRQGPGAGAKGEETHGQNPVG